MKNDLQDFKDNAYGEVSALRYNIFENRPSGFAKGMAPKIYNFYNKTAIRQSNNQILDVACGTGQLSSYLLNKGFDVIGLDYSPYMLKYAKDNNADSILAGHAQFVEGDASDFHFDRQFGLVVSTFNGLNHLSSFEQVKRSLKCVQKALVPGGYFLFDINTRLGLKDVVETVDLHDTDEEIIVRKRIFDGGRVILYASGCFLHKGVWHRYRETIFKIIIDTASLRQTMLEQGWSSVTYTNSDFTNPAEDPESDPVAYVVARK
jgi:SAM-dependent methyltransferase